MVSRKAKHSALFHLPMWAIYLSVAVVLALGVLAFALFYSGGGANLINQVTPS